MEEAEDEDKYSFNYDGSELVIHKVDKSDEAEYICIAENKAGEADATIHLKVFGNHPLTAQLRVGDTEGSWGSVLEGHFASQRDPIGRLLPKFALNQDKELLIPVNACWG